MKRMNNDMAVSPIVATLVLIVVAVIGAVAVGTIMGSFSTQVSKQANAGQASSASQTEILVAGSTTLQPVEINLASDYAKINPGIQVNVQGGSSGVGVTAVATGIADIGASSDCSQDHGSPDSKRRQPRLPEPLRGTHRRPCSCMDHQCRIPGCRIRHS